MGSTPLKFAYMTRGLIGAGGVSNDTAARLWRSISHACREKGITLYTLVGDQPGSNAQQRIFRQLEDGEVDGIISWSSMGEVEEDQDLSRFRKTPVVCLSRKTLHRPVVSIDNAMGIGDLIMHLAGHHSLSKIAFIRGPESHPYSRARWEAYLSALESLGLEYQPRLVSPWGNWDKNTGISAVEYFLGTLGLRPGTDIQAMVCANDRIAVGVLEELEHRGLRCPDDIIVTGFNHLPESDKTDPVLTTVHMPFEEQARQAVDLLLSMRENPGHAHEDRILSSDLLVRESCGCSPGGAAPVPQGLWTAFEEARASRDPLLLARGLSGDALTLPDQSVHVPQLMAWCDSLRTGFARQHPGLQDRLLAEELIGKAFSHICARDYRSRAKQEVLSFLQNEALQKLDLAFALEPDIGSLYLLLREVLPRIGIPSVYVILNREYANDATGFGYDEQGLLSGEQLAALAEGWGLQDKGDSTDVRHYLMRSIAFGTRDFGLLVFGLGPLEGTIYDSIAYKLSSTINNLILTREIEARIEELNTSNARLEQSMAELVHAQNRLIQSQKMAAVGELIAGVAHEMNTPLGVALTASTYLESEFDRCRNLPAAQIPESIREAGELITYNVKRAVSLVEQLKKNLNEPYDIRTRDLSLEQLLDEARLLVTPLLGETGINLGIRPAGGERLSIPAQLLNEIFIQLVSNAVYHGFPDGGPGSIELGAVLDSGFLRISVADNGVGMSEEVYSKAFDPFFTTRRGKGNIGLGLHGLYSLVTRNLGGSIECISSPGEGARFLVSLSLERLAELQSP